MGTDLGWEIYRDQIAQLADLEYNYDEKVYQSLQNKSGWHIDRYRAALVQEPPGRPGPAFAAVQNAIRLYQFPDPRLISAVFDPKAELHGRNMLMLAKFAGFQFRFGVRVVAVIDECRRDEHGHDLDVWGYAYRTLKGHFEVGEIRFEVSKNRQTGEVAFAVEAYSKADRIPNLFYRTGFRIFGRSLQKYFAYSSIRRLRRIARAALTDQRLQQNQANPDNRAHPNHTADAGHIKGVEGNVNQAGE